MELEALPNKVQHKYVLAPANCFNIKRPKEQPFNMSSNHITMVENIWLMVSWPLAFKKLLESQFIFHLCHKLIEGLNWPEMVWASTASLLLALPSLQYSEFEYSGQICISGNLLEVFLWFCHKNLCNIGLVSLFSTYKHLRTWDYGGCCIWISLILSIPWICRIYVLWFC